MIIRYFIILLLIQLIYLIGFSEEVDINIFAYSVEDGYNYKAYVDGFNQYSRKNNLDIKVELNVMTRNNFTVSFENSYIMVESLLKKKNHKYDIFIYDYTYLKNYSPYLLDLKNLFPKEHIDMYNKQVLSQACEYDGKLLGFPISLCYTAIYANKVLLDKYNKSIPQTWNELIETSKEIIEKEKALNNTDLVGYNGFMYDADNGLCSIYEFIYSCRDSIDSPFPEFTSETTVNALKLLKRIKNEISSDEIFRSDSFFDINLFEGRGIFIRYWFSNILYSLENSPYILAKIPGIKEGISSTAFVSYNIGIVNDIDEIKKPAALKVIEYMTSREFQKSLILKNIIITGISSLYEDYEVCSIIPYCNVFSNVQPIIKPLYKTNDYVAYSEKFTNYFYEYLYNNGTETEESVLKKIDDITRIYYITTDLKETSSGLTILILFSTTLTIMILSLIFLFSKKYQGLFSFIFKPGWIMMIIGMIMILVSGFTYFGPVTILKCNLKFILLSSGLTFIYIPILYKFIINFPEINKYSKWVYNHKLIFFSIFILFDIFIDGLIQIKSYNIKDIIINDGENFQICYPSNVISIINWIMIIYILIIITIISLLIFIEWNAKDPFYDIKFIGSSIFINFISFTIHFILYFTVIENYVLYFKIQEVVIYFITITNYITLYGVKLIYPRLMKENKINEMIKNIRICDSYVKNSYMNVNMTTTNKSNTFAEREENLEEDDISNINISNINKSNKINERPSLSPSKSIYSRILDYHYNGSNNNDPEIKIESTIS
ncbi:periplasmic binding protein-like II [Anaeromyces robustus]|uniref:Periplasmic binding protein-like II n=1 Tax=Anaeromyces robustus TaxID=1754192 RepID=A0A1Y1XHH1_9FUNG|nr:periplasmic binding protein-like II [Anaeromyces robustus]|eukprot:ORX84846.1 periplasmic binding protein-like II [Anaeromyces robustus]